MWRKYTNELIDALVGNSTEYDDLGIDDDEESEDEEMSYSERWHETYDSGVRFDGFDDEYYDTFTINVGESGETEMTFDLSEEENEMLNIMSALGEDFEDLLSHEGFENSYDRMIEAEKNDSGRS